MENNRPKILIFSLAYHPFVGGAEVAIKEITDRLGTEFEFDMITANLDGQQKEFERLGNINVYRISLFSPSYNKYLFSWLAYKKAIKLQKENNYSVIWAMMANQAGWAALKFKKKFPQVKYLLTLQEGDSEWDIFWRTFLIRPIYKAIYRRADNIQAISNFLKKRAENLGVKCSIEVVPNGIKTQNAKRKTQNDNSKLKRIITVSRLVKKNGIEDLIKAIGILKNEYNNTIVLKIIGDGKLRKKLEKLVEYLKIGDRTVLLGKDQFKLKGIEFEGPISNEKVYEYLNQADVFVRPSLSEGLGNAFLEAMAVGVPVIATPVGGIPDFLKGEEAGIDKQTGWFCKVKDPKSIAEKVNLILDDKNKVEVNRVIDNARKMVIEKYNWNKISQDIKNIFSRLLQ